MVVLGGMSSLWGALLGAVFLTVLPEFLRSVENYDIVIYGAILLACTLFLPGGLAGLGGTLLRLAGAGEALLKSLRRGASPEKGGDGP
jgi:branched-chain amino acid transport system permease protein